MSAIIGHTLWANKPQVNVVQTYIHPLYKDLGNAGMHNDIGLLVLARDVEFRPVNLAQPNASFPQSFTVLGFGTTSVGWSMMSDVLREVQVPAIPKGKCQRMWNAKALLTYPPMKIQITKRQVCSAGGIKDACSGDSGGPLIVKGVNRTEDVLYGITSFGYGCAYSGFAAVNTDVRFFYNWIMHIIENRLYKRFG